jgi:hypothetical protein
MSRNMILWKYKDAQAAQISTPVPWTYRNESEKELNVMERKISLLQI